ncbi:MAG: universal stress protein, partial [Tissierella sp.]|uniref:universal stress protein n=1 Tax=Tissierella sp. TaxID=41274 RepID=UPI003F951667
ELNVKLRRGDPADAIIKETEKEDYDLVVMGSRGLGTFSRAILGSVSNKVLNHVETNVLIVK